MTAYTRLMAHRAASCRISYRGRFWLGYLAILAVCAWAVL